MAIGSLVGTRAVIVIVQQHMLSGACILCGRRWSRTSIPSRRASSTHPIVSGGATLVYLEGGFDILRRGVMHWPPPHHRCSPALRIWASDHHRGIAPACMGQFNRFKARHPLILPSPIASWHRHMAFGSFVGTRAVMIVWQHVLSECGQPPPIMMRA